MDISAVAEPPVAIRIRLLDILRFLSLLPLAFLDAPNQPPKKLLCWGSEVTDLISKRLGSNIFFGIDYCRKVFEFTTERKLRSGFSQLQTHQRYTGQSVLLRLLRVATLPL